MASGNAIDEQKVDRWGSSKSGPIEEQESLPGPQHVGPEDVKEQDREEGSDEDSEVDPNDIIAEENLQVNSCAAGSSAGMGSSSGQARDPYEALEDDDW